MQTYDIESLKRKLLELNIGSGNVSLNKNDVFLMSDFTEVEIGNTPTQLDMAVLGLLLDGELNININGNDYLMRPNDYIVIFPNQVGYIKDNVGQASPRGIFICLSNSIYETMVQRMQEILPLFIYIKSNPCSSLKKSDVEWIKAYYDQIFNELGKADNFYRAETVRSLMIAFFYKVCNIYSHDIISEKTRFHRQNDIFKAFIRELSLNYKEHHDILFYATRLCITPKYLSNVVKQVSGKSPKEWIHNRITEEAQNLLKNTDMSIQQVSDELCFANQSFFAKYFKAHTGMTPYEYRNK